VSPEIPHERYDSYRFQAADFTMAIMESLGELSPAQKGLAARLRKEFVLPCGTSPHPSPLPTAH
jgi:hypothetical protein